MDLGDIMAGFPNNEEEEEEVGKWAFSFSVY
jgi:hypothetical protein